MVNKKKYKFRGLVSMFKKGNCLSISIDSNINLSATQLHPIHHPAGSLSHLWRLKLNHTAPLGLPILHLDVGRSFWGTSLTDWLSQLTAHQHPVVNQFCHEVCKH